MSIYPNQNLSCLGFILIGLLFLWITGLAFLLQLLAWSGLVLGIEVNPATFTFWQAVLIIIPLAPLAWLWQPTGQRAIFTAWLLAGGYLLLLVPSRLFSSTFSQTMLLSQVFISAIYLLFLWIISRRTPSQSSAAAHIFIAIALATVVSYPWLVWGALGSLLDTLLSLALGLLVGLNLGLIIKQTWLRTLQTNPQNRILDIALGGLTLSLTLFIIASGLSFNGVQLLLMLALPPVGWIALALAYQSPDFHYSWRPPAILTGLVVAGIIALTDTDVLVILALDTGLGWAFSAAVLSMLLGWLLIVIALIPQSLWRRVLPPPVAVGGAVALWLVGLGLYLFVGQPGFYGDRLFVVFKDQADVSTAVDIADYDQRRHFVYDTLVAQADESQAQLRAWLDTFGVEYQPYYLVNAVEVEGGLLARLLLMTNSDIDRILPSPVMRPLPEPLTPDRGTPNGPTEPQWNLTNLGADRVWAEFGVRGEGIVIGQSDSGVQLDHPEFSAQYRGRESGHDYNWFDPWTDTLAPIDFGGHGTHTLGSIVGQSVGVAPGAEWYACANLQRNLGNPALYLDCMQFMLAPFPVGGNPLTDGDPLRSAHVLNNSWGCPEDYEGCDPESLRPAVSALRSAGIFVVASAGNDGPECSTVVDAIAIYDEAFSVGAVDSQNNLGVFSSVGPITVDGSHRTKPDIAAPGVRVLSAFPNSTYSTFDGTSMAGPHVVGVVALVWSANPGLIGDIERTEQLLAQTATPFIGHIGGIDPEAAMAQLVGEENAQQMMENSDPAAFESPVLAGCVDEIDVSQVPNNAVGYGVVNAYEAVKAALELELR